VRHAGSLTAAEFEAALGSSFDVLDTDGRVILSLSLVEIVRRPERSGQREPFSTYWTGPETPILRHITHHLAHPELGEIEVFLGPVATDGPAVTYEAVFG
jgi:hypothetical protein